MLSRPDEGGGGQQCEAVFGGVLLCVGGDQSGPQGQLQQGTQTTPGKGTHQKTAGIATFLTPFRVNIDTTF